MSPNYKCVEGLLPPFHRDVAYLNATLSIGKYVLGKCELQAKEAGTSTILPFFKNHMIALFFKLENEFYSDLRQTFLTTLTNTT